MVRRVEAQFRRDWFFTYTLWNNLFRTSVNLSRTVVTYSKGAAVDMGDASCKDLEAAALSICTALRGKYRCADGVERPVKGDMTKVRYATDTLTPISQRLLRNIEHTNSRHA